MEITNTLNAAIRKAELKKGLAEFEAKHPEVAEKLNSAAVKYGAHSADGAAHSNAEHIICSIAKSLSFAVSRSTEEYPEGSGLDETLLEKIDILDSRNIGSVKDESDWALLDDFKEHLLQVANKLGLNYDSGQARINIEKITVLKELSQFENRHPELVDILAEASAQYGADSPIGRRHTDAEHVACNIVKRIFENLGDEYFAIQLGEDIDMIAERNLDGITDKEWEMLDGLKVAMQNIVTKLNLTTPGIDAQAQNLR